MNSDTRDFLHLLLERPFPQEHYLTLTAIHPTNEDSPRPSRHIALQPLNTRQLNTDVDALSQANAQGWGAYFAVAYRRQGLGHWQRGGKDDLVALPALFVDIDRPVPEALETLKRLPPATATLSSGGGVHAYYLLGEPTTNLNRADRIIKGMNLLVEGDSAMNISTSLRLPGSINTKPTRDHAPCKLLDLQPQNVYSLDEFPEYHPPAQIAPRLRSDLYQHTNLNPQLIQAVLDELYRNYQASPKNSHSCWHKALCPCGHNHDAPGAHFWIDSTAGAANCFGKHGSFNLHRLSTVLGISPADYGGLYI